MNTPEPVKVLVRVRPLLNGEVGGSGTSSEMQVEKNEMIFQNTQMMFDGILQGSDEERQQDIIDSCVLPIVENAKKGINACVLAYGQTGAGKTHIMGTTGWEGEDVDKGGGILAMAAKRLFECEFPEGVEVRFLASFLEIYKEKLQDLLDSSSKTLDIREDKWRGIWVSGVREEQVFNLNQVKALILRGSANRTTAKHSLNDRSSRSHAIFTLVMQQKRPFVENIDGKQIEGTEFLSSKCHFVDLAGSERAKRTNAEKERLRESSFINYGLLALGNVILALSESGKNMAGAAVESNNNNNGDEAGNSNNNNGQMYIPYRDSKLTRVLQDCLGGGSFTVLLACVSPSIADQSESLQTLKYAARARFIKNLPRTNTVIHAGGQLLQPETARDLYIVSLRSQLQNLLSKEKQDEASGPSGEEVAALRAQVAYLQWQNQELIRRSRTASGVSSVALGDEMDAEDAQGGGGGAEGPEMDEESEREWKEKGEALAKLVEDSEKVKKLQGELGKRIEDIMEAIAVAENEKKKIISSLPAHSQQHSQQHQQQQQQHGRNRSGGGGGGALGSTGGTWETNDGLSDAQKVRIRKLEEEVKNLKDAQKYFRKVETANQRNLALLQTLSLQVTELRNTRSFLEKEIQQKDKKLRQEARAFQMQIVSLAREAALQNKKTQALTMRSSQQQQQQQQQPPLSNVASVSQSMVSLKQIAQSQQHQQQQNHQVTSLGSRDGETEKKKEVKSNVNSSSSNNSFASGGGGAGGFASIGRGGRVVYVRSVVPAATDSKAAPLIPPSNNNNSNNNSNTRTTPTPPPPHSNRVSPPLSLQVNTISPPPPAAPSAPAAAINTSNNGNHNGFVFRNALGGLLKEKSGADNDHQSGKRSQETNKRGSLSARETSHNHHHHQQQQVRRGDSGSRGIFPSLSSTPSPAEERSSIGGSLTERRSEEREKVKEKVGNVLGGRGSVMASLYAAPGGAWRPNAGGGGAAGGGGKKGKQGKKPRNDAWGGNVQQQQQQQHYHQHHPPYEYHPEEEDNSPPLEFGRRFAGNAAAAPVRMSNFDKLQSERKAQAAMESANNYISNNPRLTQNENDEIQKRLRALRSEALSVADGSSKQQQQQQQVPKQQQQQQRSQQQPPLPPSHYLAYPPPLPRQNPQQNHPTHISGSIEQRSPPIPPPSSSSPLEQYASYPTPPAPNFHQLQQQQEIALKQYENQGVSSFSSAPGAAAAAAIPPAAAKKSQFTTEVERQGLMRGDALLTEMDSLSKDIAALLAKF